MRRLIPTLITFFVLTTPANAAWVWPVSGEVITPYRNGTDPYAAGQHRGIDIAAPVGTRVVAAAGGDVRFAGTAGSSGLTISIRTADGYDTSYLHLSSLAVRAGGHVAAGERIGAVGTSGVRSATAPHLHFGVRDAGSRHDYHDPLAFLPPPPAGAPEPPAAAPAPSPVPAPPAAAPIVAPPGVPAPHRARRAAPRPSHRTAPRLAPRAAPRPGRRAAPRPAHRAAPRSVHHPEPSPLEHPRPAPEPAGRPPVGLASYPADRPALHPARATAPSIGRAPPALGHPHRTSVPAGARALARGAGSPRAAQDNAAGRIPAHSTPSPDASRAPGATANGHPNRAAGGPDIAWAATCAGLLLAAALLGLTGGRRGPRHDPRPRSHRREKLLAALRPLAGRR